MTKEQTIQKETQEWANQFAKKDFVDFVNKLAIKYTIDKDRIAIIVGQNLIEIIKKYSD